LKYRVSPGGHDKGLKSQERTLMHWSCLETIERNEGRVSTPGVNAVQYGSTRKFHRRPAMELQWIHHE